MSTNTGGFIKLCKIMEDSLFFSLYATEAVFRKHSGFFLRKKLTAKTH